MSQSIFTSSQDMLRLIEIEGVDINPCGGTHMNCTSQLQVLKIVGLEKSKGQARLRFMVGGRVIAALGASLQREVALNKVCKFRSSRKRDVYKKPRRVGVKCCRHLKGVLCT